MEFCHIRIFLCLLVTSAVVYLFRPTAVLKTAFLYYCVLSDLKPRRPAPFLDYFFFLL